MVLVDELGGLEDAIKLAASMVEIDEYRIRSYPDYKREFKDMFSGPFGSVKQQVLLHEIGKDNLKIYKQLQQFGDWKGIQTRLPFLIRDQMIFNGSYVSFRFCIWKHFYL